MVVVVSIERFGSNRMGGGTDDGRRGAVVGGVAVTSIPCSAAGAAALLPLRDGNS